jgi:hypothetical protein
MEKKEEATALLIFHMSYYLVINEYTTPQNCYVKGRDTVPHEKMTMCLQPVSRKLKGSLFGLLNSACL